MTSHAIGIREAMEKTSSIFAKQPARARSENIPATARIADELRHEVRGPNGEAVHTDTPPPFAGAASAPGPGWLFRAAVASCTAIVIAMRAFEAVVSLLTNH